MQTPTRMDKEVIEATYHLIETDENLLGGTNIFIVKFFSKS